MSNIHRPNYAAGIELDGPYRPSHALRAMRLRTELSGLLAALLHWIKP